MMGLTEADSYNKDMQRTPRAVAYCHPATLTVTSITVLRDRYHRSV